jgi:hypothetical protein
LYYVNYVGFVFVWYSFFFGFLSLNVFFIGPLWAQNWFNEIILSYLSKYLIRIFTPFTRVSNNLNSD